MSDRTKIFLLLAPALTIIIFLFLGGLISGFMRSLNYMPIIGLTEPNLNSYISVFKSIEFYYSFILSFYIAFTSTLISLILAIGAVLLLRKNFIGKSIINFLLNSIFQGSYFYILICFSRFFLSVEFIIFISPLKFSKREHN